jgi:mevalonate kinase
MGALLSAPGKLFLIGEYVVLDGGTAVVAAVEPVAAGGGLRAQGRLVAGAAPSTPLVAEAVRETAGYLATRGIEPPAGAPEIDTRALADDGKKLGLGSSAAAAAIAVGALLDAAGDDLDAHRALAFSLALRAHRAAQGGRGSGADVAAAVFGGVIAFTPRADAAPDIEPLGPPPGEVVVFSTGTPSATVDHVRAVERLAERDGRLHATRMAALRAAANTFRRAYESGDLPTLIGATHEAEATLAALGRDADLPIVTPPLAAAAALARTLGGAAKPSGAGGGDVGVAFFASREAADAFRARAEPLALRILSIRLAARGLSRDLVAA